MIHIISQLTVLQDNLADPLGLLSDSDTPVIHCNNFGNLNRLSRKSLLGRGGRQQRGGEHHFKTTYTLGSGLSGMVQKS